MKFPHSHEHKRMYFVGVSTLQSSIMKVFPLWMEELGRPEISLEGMDLKLHDDPANYRRAVIQIKGDPLCLGALVTTHKINLLKATRDLFDYLDPLAQVSGEVSCISKRDGRLEGHAKDPISGGLSLDTVLRPGYFGRTGGHVLSLGAGGSTTALVLAFQPQAASCRPAAPDGHRQSHRRTGLRSSAVWWSRWDWKSSLNITATKTRDKTTN